MHMQILPQLVDVGCFRLGPPLTETVMPRSWICDFFCTSSWVLDIGLQPHINSATRAIGYKQAMHGVLAAVPAEWRRKHPAGVAQVSGQASEYT
jgi:hypothetical protein